MIDLHMHTNYSDGTDTLKELLRKANEKSLEVISITDHNTCIAYEEMEKFNVLDYFKGNIIVGCEFTTSFDNQLIEILGYEIDYNVVNEYMNNYYNKEFNIESNFKIYVRLIKKIIELKLICDFENVKIGNSILIGIYNELAKNQENKNILNEDVFNSYSDFYRKALANPNSKLFLNFPEFKPSLKEIVNLIHTAGGKAFLAHPYQYKLENTEEFLNKIYDEFNLDGIECFYTTFTSGQTNYLINFAKMRNLLISGGSDYHGANKKQHELGIGKGNLNISKEIISNWDL